MTTPSTSPDTGSASRGYGDTGPGGRDDITGNRDNE
jgi:hypothetical protein